MEHPSAHITWGECAANGSRSFTGYTLEQMHRAVRSHTSSVFEERLAAFWRKLRSGERVRVLTLGGSLTQGARMCCDSVTPWPVFLSWTTGLGDRWIQIGLEAVWPANPEGYDLVVVETGSNDMAIVSNFHQTSEYVKAAMELIVLRVRAKSSAALLLLETFPGGRIQKHGFFDTAKIRATWKQDVPIFQDAYVNGDSLHVEVARYYGVPQVSLAQALFPEYRLWREDSSSHWHESKWIDQCCPPCYDAFHPNAEGQARFAELAASYLVAFGQGLPPDLPPKMSHERPRPLFVSESVAEAEESPAVPLILDFQVSNGGSHVAFAHGWSHFEDVPGKPGWISQRSNVSTSDVEPGPTNFGGLRELGFTFVSGALGQLQIGYLKSHKTGMGIVNFTVRCDRPRGRSTTRLLAASHVYHRLRFDGSHNSPTSVPTYTTVTGLIPRAACNATFVLNPGPPKSKVVALKAS